MLDASAERRGHLEVLMVIEGEIATTQLIERVLAACAAHGLRYRKRRLRDLRIEDFHTRTIPLFVRCDSPALEAWIELLLRAQHPYLYYIDDNFWRIEGDSPLARHYRHPLIRRSLEFAVTHAEGVLTNSGELARFLGRFTARTRVLPAFFDFALIDGVTAPATCEVRVGFAGSPSRGDDLDIVAPLLESVLADHPQVVFEFAGVLPRGQATGDRVRFFPHTADYGAFARFQAGRGWAIGLAPLRDIEANRCKTNNKYREYGASHTAGIYSDLAPYRDSVTHGLTGLLVDNAPEAWLGALDQLCRDAAARLAMGRRAHADVLERFCVERVAGEWAAVFRDVDRTLHRHPAAPLKSVRRGLSARRIRSHVETAAMQVGDAYREGNLPMVLRKSVKRMFKSASALRGRTGEKGE